MVQKNRPKGASSEVGRGVTANAERVSRATFRQVIHRENADNFLRFFDCQKVRKLMVEGKTNVCDGDVTAFTSLPMRRRDGDDVERDKRLAWTTLPVAT